MDQYFLYGRERKLVTELKGMFLRLFEVEGGEENVVFYCSCRFLKWNGWLFNYILCKITVIESSFFDGADRISLSLSLSREGVDENIGVRR